MAKPYKIVIMGAGGVGRTSISSQFVHGIFVDRYDPTVENTFRIQVELNGKSFLLEILVTAGNGTEQFTAIKDYYMRNGEGFMLVYSITAKSTFQDIKELREEILRAKKANSSQVPILIVGNKIDLEDQREIPTSEGESLAKELGCNFLETSAKTADGVVEAFELLVSKVEEAIPQHVTQRDQCIIS